MFDWATFLAVIGGMALKRFFYEMLHVGELVSTWPIKESYCKQVIIFFIGVYDLHMCI